MHVDLFWTVMIYLVIWEYEFVSYILQEFFNYFSFSCYAPPLKNLPNSDSLDDIISQSSVSWTKDTDICLPTKWILDYNGSACFPTIGYHSLSFLDIPWAFLTLHMLIAQCIFGNCHCMINECHCEQVVNWGKRHTIAFCLQYAKLMMIDWWCHLGNLSLEDF